MYIFPMFSHIGWIFTFYTTVTSCNESDGVSNYRRLDGFEPFVQAQIKKKHQRSASQAFVRGIHRWMRKMFPFDDVIMIIFLFSARAVPHNTMPGRQQANILASAGILLIGPMGTNFGESWTEIPTFSFKKNVFESVVYEMRLFRLGLNVITAPLDTKLSVDAILTFPFSAMFILYFLEIFLFHFS